MAIIQGGVHKKGDQELLGNYRPIALLTSICHLINIILADRLQTLAERHCLFESSQFGFRWLTGVNLAPPRGRGYKPAKRLSNKAVGSLIVSDRSARGAGRGCVGGDEV
jgi:hypothetical protein